jgi:hypothetical protein
VLGVEPSYWLLLFTLASTLLMDLDMVIYYFRRRGVLNQYAHEHRDLSHHPIPFSIGMGAIWWCVLGKEYALLWVTGSTFHFLNDTFNGGWGVKWLSPFCSWYFTMAAYSPVKIIKTKEHQRKMASLFGDPEWAKKKTKINIQKALELMGLILYFNLTLIWIFIRSNMK